MASTILADNGASSGSAGIKTSADSTGVLALQTTTAGGAATTAVTIGTDQSVTFAQAANLPNTFGFKNRIINGAMMIDQRNAGASVTPSGSDTSQYCLDRFYLRYTVGSKLSVQRSTDAPAGFSNSTLITSLSSYSVGANDHFEYYHGIEGNNLSDLALGTASAKPFTLSFWVKSSLTGTFGLTFANGVVSRCYIATYTITAANTWEYKTVTINPETSGAWASDNSAGMFVGFGLGAGSNVTNAASSSWYSAFFRGATGATSVVGTSGATFYITGVQLEKGSTATSFDYRPYGTELALCQRYYYQLAFPDGAFRGRTTINISSIDGYMHGFLFSLPVEQRTSGTVTVTQSAGNLCVVAQNGAAQYNCTSLNSGWGSDGRNVYMQYASRSNWSNPATGPGQILFSIGGTTTYAISAEL